MAFSFRHPFVAHDAGLSAPDLQRELSVYDPQEIMDRISRTLRRRLSDGVEDIFQVACLSGDLEGAEDLLTVLVNLQARGRRAFGGERRVNDDVVAKAQAELARRKALRRLQTSYLRETATNSSLFANGCGHGKLWRTGSRLFVGCVDACHVTTSASGRSFPSDNSICHLPFSSSYSMWVVSPGTCCSVATRFAAARATALLGKGSEKTPLSV